MSFFSIIIPVHNTEKYLKQCINSILHQKFDDYEIILIDDFSTDKSEAICKSYKKNKNFQVHRNESQIGPGLSRNIGIKLSKGKYLIFLDSDDLLYDNSLQGSFKLLKNKNKDVLITKFASDKPPYSNSFFFHKKFNTKKNLISSINKNDYQTIVCWHYIIKKNFLTKNKIKFKDLKNCEDHEFVTKVLCKMKSFDFFKKNYYWYRSSLGGLSQSIDLVTTKSYISFLIELFKFYNNEEWKKYLKVFIGRQIKNTIEQLSYRLMLHKDKSDNKKIKEYIHILKLKNPKDFSYFSSDKSIISKNMLSDLDFNLLRNKNIYIYCAHVYGLAMYNELIKRLDVQCIIDDNPNVSILIKNFDKKKLQIKSPEELIGSKNFNIQNCKILVCARTIKTFDDILAKLYQLGVPKKNVINKVSYFYKKI